MPVSGTVPVFDTSTTPDPTGPTIVSVSGAVSGTATGEYSSESLPQFYRRALGLLTLSGTLDTGEQRVPPAVVSGLRNLQQELALRIADLELPREYSNVARLAHANGILTASGEVQFGS